MIKSARQSAEVFEMWETSKLSDDDVTNVTYMVNGRGIDVRCLNISRALNEADEESGYYEVTGPNLSPTLIFSGPPMRHKRVLEYALVKWHEMEVIDEGMAHWPMDRVFEV